MAYWLLKTEPEEYSWDDLKKKGAKGDAWTGVRNFTARNHLNAMKKGDRAFIYHTGDEKQVVGVAEVVRESYPDPTDEKGVFLSVDVKTLDASAQAGDARRRQSRQEAGGDGAGEIQPPVGAAGHRRGMEDRLQAGRPLKFFRCLALKSDCRSTP